MSFFSALKDFSPEVWLSSVLYIYPKDQFTFSKKSSCVTTRLNAGFFWAVLIIAILCQVRIQTYNAGRSGFVF